MEEQKKIGSIREDGRTNDGRISRQTNSINFQKKKRKEDQLVLTLSSFLFDLPAPVAAEFAAESVDFVVVAVASLAIKFLDYHEYHQYLSSPFHLVRSHSMTNYCSNFVNYSTLACYSSAYHFAYESTNCLSLSSNNYRYHSGTVCSRKYKIRRVLNVDVAGLQLQSIRKLKRTKA